MAKAKNGNGDAGEPGIGHNGLGDKGKSYVERIEALMDELDAQREAFKSAAKEYRDDIKEIVEEAKGAGISAKSLKAVIKARALSRKADAARDALGAVDRDTFDNIRLALGDLADTPLGAAATVAAGQPQVQA